MEHARCAVLHNYPVHYAWIAEGRAPASLQADNGNNTCFAARSAAAEALRPRLDPSFAAFLDAAVLPPADATDPPPFFFFVSALSDPDGLFDNQTADMFDEPEDSVVCLYIPNIGQGRESGGGLFYRQGHHRAGVFVHMGDYNFALHFDAHPELWYPLETVLCNWIDLVHMGKIRASPRGWPALFGVEKIGPWEWRPYSEVQAATCVAAWDQLEAVERHATDNAEEGFRLLLPYALQGDDWDADAGASKSDGSSVHRDWVSVV
ncbi:hypothetical protein VTI74DRAFT_6331 [Chaetomium olivicolor]